jgi:hypothetical protein
MFEKLGSKFATLVRRDPADRLAAALRTLDQGWSETAFETLRNFGACTKTPRAFCKASPMPSIGTGSPRLKAI